MADPEQMPPLDADEELLAPMTSEELAGLFEALFEPCDEEEGGNG